MLKKGFFAHVSQYVTSIFGSSTYPIIQFDSQVFLESNLKNDAKKLRFQLTYCPVEGLEEDDLTVSQQKRVDVREENEGTTHGELGIFTIGNGGFRQHSPAGWWFGT
jgi:hypothetical protein